jgi:hypothetical protein
MPDMERVRESVSGLPSPEYFARKSETGWTLVGLEWERAMQESAAPARLHEVPFGFRIAPDCRHLEENDEETRALTVMMELIVGDRPLSQVADELNLRGFRTRRNSRWSPVDVFKLLPRLVESGPQIFASTEWVALKQRAIAT